MTADPTTASGQSVADVMSEIARQIAAKEARDEPPILELTAAMRAPAADAAAPAAPGAGDGRAASAADNADDLAADDLAHDLADDPDDLADDPDGAGSFVVAAAAPPGGVEAEAHDGLATATAAPSEAEIRLVVARVVDELAAEDGPLQARIRALVEDRVATVAAEAAEAAANAAVRRRMTGLLAALAGAVQDGTGEDTGT